jgi:branched-chain amino acid transport system ATP-binding protein
VTGRPVLTVADLRVGIAGSSIVQGVGFTVAATGVTALLGRNGAGKTTTVRAILGLLPSTGTVTLAGQDVTGWPTHRIVRAGVGYAPEDRGVFAGLTVAENLALAERPNHAHDYDTVYELFPELRRRAGQPAGSLSGGQQQMVAIARTLLNPNRLVIADEPTKGLAPRVVGEVADALSRLGERVPLLLVEQNLAVVRDIGTDAVVLSSGRVAHTGPIAELVGDPGLARALLGVDAGRRTDVPG